MGVGVSVLVCVVVCVVVYVSVNVFTCWLVCDDVRGGVCM